MKEQLTRINTEQKLVAMTFDDGPDPVYTPQILEIFRQHGVKATFFTIGEKLEQYPDIARNASEEGHELGNHTYSHPHLTQITREEQQAELDRTEKEILKITGGRSRVLRPPYLDWNEEAGELAAVLDYEVIGATNLHTNDWADPGVEHIVKTVRSHIVNGAILLLHDSGGDRSQTVEAVRTLVPEIVEQGFQLVTVSELLQAASDGK